MPAVRYLDRVGGTLLGALGIFTTPIPADHLDTRMVAQPIGDRRSRAILQEIDDPMCLEVHEDRPVAPPPAPRPVVHAEHARPINFRLRRHPDVTQERIGADRQLS